MKEHIVVCRQECPLRQLQKADLGNARDQRKVKVLEPLLVWEGSGFETLAQLLLMPLSQFPFEQRLASSPDIPTLAAQLRGPAASQSVAIRLRRNCLR